MPEDLALSLEQAIERESRNLQTVSDHDASAKPSADAWSQKEELGHLIDSCSNNHVRFVRASIEPDYAGPGYQQDAWVDAHGYRDMPWTDLIDFWKRYNLFLARLVRRIPESALERRCVIGGSRPVTLRFLIEDYILHMQHHLDHLLKREKLTQYPGAAIGV